MDGAGSSLIAAISTSYIPGSKSHGKPYDRRGNPAEAGYGPHGASVGTGGARNATVAGSYKSGSTESESTAASGTITRYVAATGLDHSDIDVFAASNIFHILHLSGGESHGKPSSRGRGNSTESGCRTHGASDSDAAAPGTNAPARRDARRIEPESTAASGTITGYVAAANMDNPNDDAFAASDIVHFSGSKSHGKPSGGRSDTTEDRSRTYGASVGTGGARSATVAEGRKSGSAEPEPAVASGTIARYVAATGMDNSDVAVFTA